MWRRYDRIWRLTISLVLLMSVPAPIAFSQDIEKWLLMPGEVASAHAAIEADCELCHLPLTEISQTDLCIDCHTTIGEDIFGRKGLHGHLAAQGPIECSSCHTDHEGRDSDITGLDAATFNHELTDFALHGAHEEISCDSCHLPEDSFRSAETTCNACHANDDVHRGTLGQECAACHSEQSWSVSQFNHDLTAFALTGAHDGVACDSCHLSSALFVVSSACVDCHTHDDVHRGMNGRECADCHSTDSWETVLFDHFAISGFRLQGAHDGLACMDCHSQPDHAGLAGSTCNSCHAKDDVHEGRFGTDCQSCHGVIQWRNTSFNHALETGFSLPAGHEDLACESCHSKEAGNNLPTTCGGCHTDDDPHNGQLGTACESCHAPETWTAQLWFDHDITAFPLLGVHATTACGSCHDSAAFKDATSACIDCHADDDVHRGGLGPECGSCHNPSRWSAWEFDHQLMTSFALTGAHLTTPCSSCHVEDLDPSASLPTDCNGCHRRDDPHNGRFGTSCDSCHSTGSFSSLEGMQ